MSLPFDYSINHYHLDDTENDFSNFDSLDNSSQSLNINLDENLEPPETYREIIERRVGDITNNDSSESNSPYFIVRHQIEQIEQEKKRRGRQIELNAKRTKKERHSSKSEDNILTKIQTHFLNFVIFFLNECVYNYYKNRKIKFIKFAHIIKAKVTSQNLSKMKNLTIYDLLKENEISSKFKRYNKNNNKKNAEILSEIPWFKKIFELKFFIFIQILLQRN